MAINFDEELIRVDYVIGEDTITETISGTIEIPNEKPGAQRIIEAKAFQIADLDTTIEEGGVDLNGTVEVGVVYVGTVSEDELQQPVHFVEGELPLTNFVDIPEAEPGMNVFADVNIRRVSFTQLPMEAEDVREFEVTVVIQKFVKVTEYRQITVITDVSGISEENITEELLRIEDVIGENTVTVVATGTLPLPDNLNKPPIERILNASADITAITTDVSDDAVTVSGNVEGGVMYVADVDEQPVHFLEGSYTFNESIDIAGALEGLNAYANVTIQRVSYDIVADENGQERVELDVVLRVFVKVTEPKQVTVITDVISDQVEIERDLLRVEDVIGEDVVHETFTKRLSIPSEKPLALRIVESYAQILDYEAMTEAGGVMLEGDIQAGAVYVGSVPDTEFQQPVHYVERPETEDDPPFNFDNFIDIPGTEPGMNTHTEVVVQKVSAELVNCETTEEGVEACSAIEFDIVLRKFVKVTEYRQLEIVTDIVVVSPAADDECPPSYVVYVVQSGDTLWRISRKYHTTVDALIEANPNIDPDNLQVGQKICVPSDIIRPKG
ncbi:MAG: DUF3794 and LysM peptidoglycan-binding domain-containing protein [Halothermotrichaceae bacterium]